MFRRPPSGLEVFLAHPGGPFFKNKDAGHWTIPKGELDPGEEPLHAAIREFQEEIGLAPPLDAAFIPLGQIEQKGGKIVHAWAFAGDWPEGKAPGCNHCQVEWPPRSGHFIQIPEIDRVAFFDLPTARIKLKDRQLPFLDRLEEGAN